MKFVPRELRETADISRGHSSPREFLKNSLSVLIVLLALYLFLGLVAEAVARTLPDRWEVQLFSAAALGLAVESANEVDDDDLAAARALFEALLATAESRPLAYQLFVIDDDDPNAIALPGGAVGLTRGLLDRLDTEIGLATVLAHELGHHQHRHILRQLGRGILYRVSLALLFGDAGAPLVEAPLALADSGYSRRQESEADEFALRLVHAHFGHTDGSLEFFEMIEAEFDSNAHSWGAFLSSHPLTTERIQHLRQLQSELK